MKYRNKIVRADGKTFDSKKEYHRWLELKEMESYGWIKELKHHVLFVLLPKNDKHNRPVQYEADYTYFKDGQLVVEDCKGFRTDVYRIKKRMMSQLLGIEVVES